MGAYEGGCPNWTSDSYVCVCSKSTRNPNYESSLRPNDPHCTHCTHCASQTPSITFGVGGVGEYIESGHNGLVIEPSAIGLAYAISSLVVDQERRVTMGKNARALVLHRLSEEAVMGRMHGVWTSLYRQET